MAFASGSSSKSSEINVTPLIDVLLVLLVIFMVVAPSASRGLESSVPQGKGTSAAEPGPVVVRLLGGDAGGPMRYRIGSSEADVALGELESRLRGMFAVREDRTVFVEAAPGVSYGHVAEVVADAKRAGAASVALSRSERSGR